MGYAQSLLRRLGIRAPVSAQGGPWGIGDQHDQTTFSTAARTAVRTATRAESQVAITVVIKAAGDQSRA
jgi:hypothetical protein